MTDTFVVFEGAPDVAYRLSGQFTTTVKTQLDLSTLSAPIGAAMGISIDDTDTFIINDSADILNYLSGQFSTTIKQTISMSTQTLTPYDVTVDTAGVGVVGVETGGNPDELVYYSGFLSTTLKDSFDTDILHPDQPRGISFTATDTIVMFPTLTKVLSLSGKFSSMIHDSQILSDFDAFPSDVDATGDGIIFSNQTEDVLTKTLGFFTSGLDAQLDISSVDTGSLNGCAHGSFSERLSNVISVSVETTWQWAGGAFRQHLYNRYIDHFIQFQGKVGPTYLSIEDELKFTDTPETFGSTYNITWEDTFDFTQDVYKTINTEADSENTIMFTGTVVRVYEVENTLNLTGTAGGISAVDAEHTLMFTDEVTIGATIRRTATNTLDLNGVLAAYLEGVDLYNYDPQPPQELMPAVNATDEVTLEDNLGNPVNQVTLRNPDFGNTETLRVFRALNISRSGKQNIFREDYWPIDQTLNFTFSALSQTEANNLQEFLSDTAGEKIRLIDWEGRTWVGVVTNPDSAIIDTGPNCKYQATINFVGDLVLVDGNIYTASVSNNMFLTSFYGYTKIPGNSST